MSYGMSIAFWNYKTREGHRMMRAAFAHWESRIAPVFDVARYLQVIDIESGHVISEHQETLLDDLPVQKALRLAELGVEVLVCGAISRPLHEMILAYGIQVVPFIAGDMSSVVHAWLRGKLRGNAFAMPGCTAGGRRGGRGMKGMYPEGWKANGSRSGTGGTGGGRGQGPGGRRSVQMGGAAGAGPSGYCLCPQCGYREPHERGIPCVEGSCPRCGTTMGRE